MNKNVAFIGLGIMGFPMAGHLAKAGYNVRVYNRTQETAERWKSTFPGQTFDSPKSAAQHCQFVFTCVGDDMDLKQVTLGKSGVFAGLDNNAILIDHTTASAQVARELGSMAEKNGTYFIDAPVSGGQQGAENGELTIMCGTNETTFNQAKPVLNTYAKAVSLMGPHGAGQLTKMVNQITIAGLIQGLAEGLHFAEQAGLDQQQVIDVISKGAAQSWQMDNRHKTMIADQYEHGFATDLMRKDLAICLEEARRNQSTIPITALVDQFYADIQSMGGNKWDTSSLLKRIKKT